jgi:hypothetical protein
MPGIGPRIWHPQIRVHAAELPTTAVNLIVEGSDTLDGTTTPFQSYTGSMLVRIVGRAMKATRPLNVQVRWNGILMQEQAFYVESGAGGCFVGMWALLDQVPAPGNIVITCGTGNAGVAAIRVGEITGKPVPVAATAKAGYSVAYVMTATAVVVAGGCVDADAFPFSSPDFDTQWGVKIPPKTDLPNRHNGLAAYFGLTYSAAADGSYDIIPRLPINGVISLGEMKITQ